MVQRSSGVRPAGGAPIVAVILDVDGTLVDSNDAHTRAWMTALNEHGISMPYDRVRSQIGVERGRMLRALTGCAPESPAGRRILERRTEILLSEHLRELRVFPNTRRLLEKMRDDGLRRIAASPASAIEVDALLQVAGVADLVEAPSYHVRLAAAEGAGFLISLLQELDLNPDQVVLVGDTPYDVEAGIAARVRVIALRCGGWGDRALVGATAVFDDASDLLRYYDASPLAERRQTSSESA